MTGGSCNTLHWGVCIEILLACQLFFQNYIYSRVFKSSTFANTWMSNWNLLGVLPSKLCNIVQNMQIVRNVPTLPCVSTFFCLLIGQNTILPHRMVYLYNKKLPSILMIWLLCMNSIIQTSEFDYWLEYYFATLYGVFGW